MDSMEEIRETFFLECEELLETLESDLSALSDGTGDSETINSIFRAVHSIKGGAGAFALEDLVRFAHTFETTLDEVRSERLEATEDNLRVFLRAKDLLADTVRASRDSTPVDTENLDSIIGLLNEMAGTCQQDTKADGEGYEDLDFQPIALDFGVDLDAEENVELRGFRIRFLPQQSLYQTGSEPAILINMLAEMGELTIVTETERLPAFNELSPEEAYIGWTMELQTEESEESVRDVFDFIDTDCELSIENLSTDIETANELPKNLNENAIGADTVGGQPPEAGNEPPKSSAAAQSPKEFLEAMEATQANTAKPVEPKATTQAATPKAVVRVDLERVDRLINLVGELVINQAMLTECVSEMSGTDTQITNGLEEFKQLTREIQESVMAIRAQPVKSLFQRMSRIVREGADATGKKVRLKLDGETTEVDKTVIERLSDPLTHMIRNAVDHGLETTERRIEAGKSAEGVVTLSAAHRSGRVIIEVSDDGGGINRERVFEKAVEKGLISPDAQLSNSEIDNLLFLPGFSTAAAVSDLSGRGVGMDVVKRSIQALGGKILVSSEPGKGSTFTISLPLTLAVLDGMLVNVAGQTLVMPLTTIVETLKPVPSDVQNICDDAKVLYVRDRFVPLIDIGETLGYRAPLQSYEDLVVLLIESDDGTRAALMFDGIQDQRQVVIKGLEDNYGHVPGVAAATILGDGRIALILDPESLIQQNSVSMLPEEMSRLTAGVSDVVH